MILYIIGISLLCGGTNSFLDKWSSLDNTPVLLKIRNVAIFCSVSFLILGFILLPLWAPIVGFILSLPICGIMNMASRRSRKIVLIASAQIGILFGIVLSLIALLHAAWSFINS